MTQKKFTPQKVKTTAKKIIDVNVDLKAGGTLNLVDINAVKQWIAKHTNKSPKSMYDRVHLILDNHITKSNLKELHKKHINKQWKKTDAIKTIASKFLRSCVMNN